MGYNVKKDVYKRQALHRKLHVAVAEGDLFVKILTGPDRGLEIGGGLGAELHGVGLSLIHI